MPAGRPSEYDPAYCDKVVGLGRSGMSRAEIAAELDVSRNTLKAWEGQHPEFLTALQRAHDLSLAWWEKQSRLGLAKKEFNSSLWSRAVSGRFPNEPYRERMQVTGKDDGPIQHVDVGHLSDEDLARLEGVLGPLLGSGEAGADEESSGG